MNSSLTTVSTSVRFYIACSILITAFIAATCAVAKDAPYAVNDGVEHFSVAEIFDDHMVLQRDQPIFLWGKSVPQTAIKASFRGLTATADVNADGRWTVQFPAMTAGGPFNLAIQSGAETARFTDIYIGDVWLAAGQSNMAFRLKHSNENEKAEALGSLGTSNIRMYQVAKQVSGGKLLHQQDVSWTVAEREVVEGWSAVGFYFAKALHAEREVPIGIIDVSQGSSTIEAWMSPDALQAARRHGYSAAELFTDIKRYYRTPSVLYNTMLRKVIPYPIKGVIWYQGESNALDAKSYRILLPEMIADWRTVWGQKNLPFLFAQLPGYDSPLDPTGTAWAEFRAAQQQVARVVDHAAMVTLVDTGERDNIHPKDKKIVGERFARVARAKVYGENIDYAGPSIATIDYANNTAAISFHHTGQGLVSDGKSLTGFFIKNSTGVWIPAVAAIIQNQVVVSHPAQGVIRGVRYGWANFPEANLYNRSGFPAVPFQIEDDQCAVVACEDSR